MEKKTFQYVCRFCKKEFLFPRNLAKHIREEHIPDLPCQECNKKFTGQRNLDIHMEEHVHERPCLECHKRFASESFLQYMTKPHKDTSIPCPLCLEIFRCDHKLKNHLRKHEVHYRCKYCEDGFMEMDVFENHVKSHVEENKCVCKICQSVFQSQQNLMEHMEKSHVHEMPCPKCHKSFPNKVTFWKHMEMHYNKKKFPCSVCKKTLWSEATLKNHMKMHAEEKPFACKACGRGFISKRQLEDHMEVHNYEKPYNCIICHLDFLFERNYLKHVTTWHGGSDLCKISAVYSLAPFMKNVEEKPQDFFTVIE